MLRPAPLLAASGLLAVAVPATAEDPYPTDTCVSTKLESAAGACQWVVALTGLHAHLTSTDNPAGSSQPAERWDALLDLRLSQVRDALAASWSDAEATALASGVECSDTTVSSDAMATLLEDGARSIVDAAGAGAGPGRSGGTCTMPLASKAATACRGFLEAYGDHLGQRSQDRGQTQLAGQLEAAAQRLERGLQGVTRSCGGDATAAEIETRVGALVDDALLASTVSPSVPTGFSEVVPDAQVDYAGRTLEPTCSAGTPWSFWVRRGTVNKLLVYYQGGGACWSGLTCGGLPQFGIDPTFKQSTGPFDNPANFSTGFADMSNPENPFRDWHFVFVPYCTGDVHWGDAVVDHENELTGEITTIRHKGFVNAQVAEKWAREHFVFPEQVFVSGSSAGSYGALVNSLYLQEFPYPSTDVAVLGDAGNGVITDDFLSNDLAKWGIEQNLPDWIPALDVPIEELNAADLWAESAKFYGQNRFATYTSSYDGGTGGQSGFYNIMLNPGNIFVWPRWWEASCEWNGLMRDLNDRAAIEASNFRFYVGAGSRHTMWGSDKVYGDTTGNVPTIRNWVAAMIAGNGDWENVACDDCEDVLPGDPTPPSLPTPPFTADGRIVCD
jgi:hypothetical protein